MSRDDDEDPPPDAAICPVCGTLIMGLPVCKSLQQAAKEPCWFLDKTLQGCRENLALKRALIYRGKSGGSAKSLIKLEEKISQ